MTRYRVLVNGKNCLLEVDGQVQKHGFYTTRIVSAGSPGEAEGRAIDAVRNLPRLRQVVLNDESDPPFVEAEEVNEVDPAFEEDEKTSGLAFYLEDT